MTKNVSTIPYMIQIDEPIQTIRLSEEDLNSLSLQLEPKTQGPATQMLVESAETPIKFMREATDSISQNFGVMGREEHQCIVQIVYPQDLCLRSAQNIAKRGRPKRKKREEAQSNSGPPVSPNPEVDGNPPKTARTRSGRLIKLPKHMEKDFKKIEVTTEEQEVKVSDFKRFEEKENSKFDFPEVRTRKRKISPQYKCPKCLKAYLGKNRMIQHLKQYPDHGPLPEGYQQFNFDIWNYLFDITQKCKAGQRGKKFCEELSNLLHNVQLLKSALFKTVTDNKNCVHIDKVLGNAIGLTPGKYKFDENELYKDVTVLKLITNGDFFQPNVNNKQVPDSAAKSKNTEETNLGRCDSTNSKRDTNSENCTLVSVNNIKNEVCPSQEESTGGAMTDVKHEEDVYSFTSKSDQCDKASSKIREDVIPDTFSKKMEVDNQILPADLLTDNILLQSLPNPRNSVDDLMLASVDNGSTLLENSTSSDEVMNVDQFVNERFKKIVGPDIELGNASLNLDLPSLELFHFHTS